MKKGKTIKIIATIALMIISLSIRAQIDAQAVTKAIEEQMNTYPESTLKDIYKSFFQDAFGPGHLIPESEEGIKKMATYLEQECETARKEESLCPDYEQTGWQGRFYRVNLSVIIDGRVPFEKFLSAFMRSAKSFTLPEVSEWKAQWIEIEGIIRGKQLGLPHFEEDAAEIMQILDSGRYASHHSEEYNRAYKPHYRLIEREIFEAELLPLIEKGKKSDN